MRILCLCALAGLLLPSAVFAQPGEDEVQKLKVEVAKLREENAQLKKELDRLSSPAAKFEQVLWLPTKDDKKGTLYLVIPVTGGGLLKQMEALRPYAAAALKEAAKAPEKDPRVVFVLRSPLKASPILGSLWDQVTGFSVKDLQRIAAAPPHKRATMFLIPAWTSLRDGVPKEAKPLQ
jgi:hypothetical protein